MRGTAAAGGGSGGGGCRGGDAVAWAGARGTGRAPRRGGRCGSNADQRGRAGGGLVGGPGADRRRREQRPQASRGAPQALPLVLRRRSGRGGEGELVARARAAYDLAACSAQRAAARRAMSGTGSERFAHGAARSPDPGSTPAVVPVNLERARRVRRVAATRVGGAGARALAPPIQQAELLATALASRRCNIRHPFRSIKLPRQRIHRNCDTVHDHRARGRSKRGSTEVAICNPAARSACAAVWAAHCDIGSDSTRTHRINRVLARIGAPGGGTGDRPRSFS